MKIIFIFLLIGASAQAVTNNESRFLANYIGVENVASFKAITKFGHNTAVTTTLAPVCNDGIYQMPTTAAALEVVSDDINDTAAGTGARTVTITGLDGDWAETSEIITLNGTTPVATVGTYTRIFRMRVTTTGTYATAAAGSHAGTITLRAAGAGAEWARIDDFQGYGVGTTQIAAYTVPAGSKAFILGKAMEVDATKTSTAANILLFVRERADEDPGGPMIMQEQEDGLSGSFKFEPLSPFGPFEGPCDILFMASTNSNVADVSVDFEILQYIPGDN